MFSIQKHQGNQWSDLNMFACCVCGRHVRWPLSLSQTLCISSCANTKYLCMCVHIRSQCIHLAFMLWLVKGWFWEMRLSWRPAQADYIVTIVFVQWQNISAVRVMMKMSRIYLDLSNFAIFDCLLYHSHSFTITLEALLTLDSSLSTYHLRIFQMHQC